MAHAESESESDGEAGLRSKSAFAAESTDAGQSVGGRGVVFLSDDELVSESNNDDDKSPSSESSSRGLSADLFGEASGTKKSASAPAKRTRQKHVHFSDQPARARKRAATPEQSPPPRRTRQARVATPEQSSPPRRTLHSRAQDARVRRSDARSAIERLRAGEIPGYDDNDRDLATRSVIVDRETFKEYRTDPPLETQEALKPPWAPRLDAYTVRQVREWEIQEALSELRLRNEPWYSMVLLVAGKLGLPPDALLVFGPNTASADAVQPSRTVPRGDRSLILADPGRGGSGRPGDVAGGDTRSYAPTTPDTRGGEPTSRRRRRQRFQPPESLLSDQSGDETLPFNTPDRPQDSARSARQSTDELRRANFARDDLLHNATRNLPTVATGARFEELRRDWKSKAATPWYAGAETPAARDMRAQRRAQGAAARSWLTRPVASGIFYTTPNYTAAVHSAHTAITASADQLSNVPADAFIALPRSGADVVQERVRTMFATAVAASFNMVRHNSNRSSKLAADAANLAAEFEGAKRYFHHRISYDARTRTFRDIGVAGELRRAWQPNPLNGIGSDAMRGNVPLLSPLGGLPREFQSLLRDTEPWEQRPLVVPPAGSARLTD